MKEKLENLLKYKNVQKSSDGKIRLKLPIHPDNINLLLPRLSRKSSPGNYLTNWVDPKHIHTTVALEGPIFRAAPQLVHMSLAIDGLKRGYLFADPITFAEEFDTSDGPREVRKKIYSNWINVIKNTDVTLALTEYGKEYDPGVVTGSIIQLSQGKPVISLALNEKSDDLFYNTLFNYHIPENEVINLITAKGGVVEDIFNLISSYKGKRIKEFSGDKNQKRVYDILIVHEKNIEGIVGAYNVSKKLESVRRKPFLLKDVTKNFGRLNNLYDLARYLCRANQAVILGDNSSEPGVIGSSAVQLSNILGVEFDFLRGDFRVLTGEGEGAGFNQPKKGLYGASNLMIESLLPRGIYTNMDVLSKDLASRQKLI